MKIAIVTDRSREAVFPGEEGRHEDEQKRETASNIKEVLSKRFECIDLIADDNIITRLKEEKVDLVFNLCNGIRGDCKLAQLPAMLEFAGIPYTGSQVIGHTLALNKRYACRVFKSMGIPTPDFIPVYSVDELEGREIRFPEIVKPSDEGSGRGIHQDSLVFDMAALKKKVGDELSTYNPPIMVTEFIDGREFTVGVLGNGNNIEVLPIMEIGFDNIPEGMARFYSFEVKAFYGDKTTYRCPADIDKGLKERIEKIAIAAYRALSIRDYARVDMRVRDGVPYVLEVNSLPGLWKDFSDLPKMADVSGLGYDGLIMRIVDSALKRQ
ncbi:MAG: ATP-grasp domain-containing protein [Thermoanaerobacteraceae bacterium]|nr:ATP-grasp domain-containing protein [Thermoanaerobacteraceae bacterium]